MSSIFANLQIQSDHLTQVLEHKNKTTPKQIHRSLQLESACGETVNFVTDTHRTLPLCLRIEASERLNPFHTIPHEPCLYLNSAYLDNRQDCTGLLWWMP